MSPWRAATRRRGLLALPAGLAGLACIMGCTPPLWLTGGLTLTGGTLVLDHCFDSWILAMVLSAATITTGMLFLAPALPAMPRTESHTYGCHMRS